MTIVDERPVRTAEVERDPPPPALRPELQHALRREIEHAIEPVLADFREQSVRSVRQQVDPASWTERGDEQSAPPPAPEPGRDARRSLVEHDDRGSGSPDGAATPALREGQTTPARSETSDLSGSVLQFLDQAGTQWVRSRLEDGRDAVCSDSVRAGVRESIERTFHPFLEAGLELGPGEGTRRALQQESEDALDELIGDALDRFCSERVLTELQQYAEAAFRAFVRFDIVTMLREVWEAIHSLLRALLVAVQDEWKRLLHLLLHFLLKAAQEMVGALLKNGLATLVAAPVEEIEEKTETAKESMEEKAAELRERLAERLEELQGRVKEEVGKVKERVAEGLQSAVEGGTRNDKFGRPPTGRPPSVRPPSGQPPTGRPPSGRPPSGQPPSITRRRG